MRKLHLLLLASILLGFTASQSIEVSDNLWSTGYGKTGVAIACLGSVGGITSTLMAMGYIGFYYIYLVVMLGGPYDAQLNSLVLVSMLMNVINLLHMNSLFGYCNLLVQHLIQ